MTARKTTQALKSSASWTPYTDAGITLARHLFGANTPLRFDGGRVMVKAAIKLDLSDPRMAGPVAERAAKLRCELESLGTVHSFAKLRCELESLGTVHSFTTQAGAVPTELVEVLPQPKPEETTE